MAIDFDPTTEPATVQDLVFLVRTLAMEMTFRDAAGPVEAIAALDGLANQIDQLAQAAEGRASSLLRVLADELFATETSGLE